MAYEILRKMCELMGSNPPIDVVTLADNVPCSVSTANAHLIAYGELFERSGGVGWRLSPLGREWREASDDALERVRRDFLARNPGLMLRDDPDPTPLVVDEPVAYTKYANDRDDEDEDEPEQTFDDDEDDPEEREYSMRLVTTAPRTVTATYEVTVAARSREEAIREVRENWREYTDTGADTVDDGDVDWEREEYVDIENVEAVD